MASRFEKKLAQKTAENPAMMFISQPEEPEAYDLHTDPETGKKTLKIQSSRATVMSPEQERPYTLQAELPAPRAPQRAEAKSRRLQLLLQPSLYEAVKERAEAEGVSVNEEIGELLRSALGLQERR